MKKLGFLLGGAAFIFIALFAAVLCWFTFSNMQASNAWPSTRGTITVSELSSPNPINPKKKKANVRYSYQVNGSRHTGSVIKFADTTGSRESLQAALIAPYPVGADVDVFYDPDNTGTAVLEPGGGLRGLLLVLPPLILAGIGGMLLYSGLQQKPAQRVKNRQCEKIRDRSKLDPRPLKTP